MTATFPSSRPMPFPLLMDACHIGTDLAGHLKPALRAAALLWFFSKGGLNLDRLIGLMSC
jgi:hypothetical protein